MNYRNVDSHFVIRMAITVEIDASLDFEKTQVCIRKVFSIYKAASIEFRELQAL